VSNKMGVDKIISDEIERALQLVESPLSGRGVRAQGTDTGTSIVVTAGSSSSSGGDTTGKGRPGSVKGGHDILIATALLAFAVGIGIGYLIGRSRVKPGQSVAGAS
jgi:hypothetical protein